MARTFSLICSLGDLTIQWAAKNDAAILPVIQQMIDTGVRFHIVRKTKEVQVKNISQAVDARKIVIPDASLQSLFASSLLTIGGLLVGETTGEIAETAEEVAAHDTIVTRPVGGG